MKCSRLLWIVACMVWGLSACKDNVDSMGVSIQPTQDAIKVCADTFHLSSENYFAEYIYSRPDSFLLGNFYDPRLGTTQAEILAQLACPVGFQYPEGAQPDSAELYLYYSTWFGDENSPVRINVYEMDKATFEYSETYPSNIDAATYCSRNTLLGNAVITAGSPVDSAYSSGSGKYVPFIRIRMPADFVGRFFNDTSYGSVEEFSQFFKGLYITTDFGTTCLLNISQMELTLFYHFSYEKDGRDTVVSNYKNFPANAEVRQVNRILHPDRETVIQSVDSINYVASPAHVFTRVRIPSKRLCDTVAYNLLDKRAYVNSAIVRVDLTDIDVDEWNKPSEHVLLIKESAMDRFFANKELPVDTCAILAALNKTDKGDGSYSYSYSFNLSGILSQEIRTIPDMRQEYIDMMMVPVSVGMTINSNYGTTVSSISSVKHHQGMSVATLNSAVNLTAPMKLSLLYSGL